MTSMMIAAGPALAAKGGGKPGSGASAASLTFSQNGVPVTTIVHGTTGFDINCAGLPANTTVYVGLWNTVGTQTTTTDSTGHCTVPWGALSAAGNYTFFVGTMSNKGFTTQATATLTVS